MFQMTHDDRDVSIHRRLILVPFKLFRAIGTYPSVKASQSPLVPGKLITPVNKAALLIK